MGRIEDDSDERDFDEWSRREAQHALSPAGIAGQNASLLRRIRDFRRAADAVVDAWRDRAELAGIVLIGSVAVAPWKEVPRFAPYRRARIVLWHECKARFLVRRKPSTCRCLATGDIRRLAHHNVAAIRR